MPTSTAAFIRLRNCSCAPTPNAVQFLISSSGPQTGQALKALAGKLPKPREAVLRTLRDGQGRALDQALVLWFEGPAFPVA